MILMVYSHYWKPPKNKPTITIFNSRHDPIPLQNHKTFKLTQQVTNLFQFFTWIVFFFISPKKLQWYWWTNVQQTFHSHECIYSNEHVRTRVNMMRWHLSHHIRITFLLVAFVIVHFLQPNKKKWHRYHCFGTSCIINTHPLPVFYYDSIRFTIIINMPANPHPPSLE